LIKRPPKPLGPRELVGDKLSTACSTSLKVGKVVKTAYLVSLARQGIVCNNPRARWGYDTFPIYISETGKKK